MLPVLSMLSKVVAAADSHTAKLDADLKGGKLTIHAETEHGSHVSVFQGRTAAEEAFEDLREFDPIFDRPGYLQMLKNLGRDDSEVLRSIEKSYGAPPDQPWSEVTSKPKIENPRDAAPKAQSAVERAVKPEPDRPATPEKPPTEPPNERMNSDRALDTNDPAFAKPEVAEEPGHQIPESQGEGVEDPVEHVLTEAEEAISDAFEPGLEGAEELKHQVEDDVLEGGNPWLGAGKASLLDFGQFAMDMAKSIPLGLLDTRRLGEGIQEGTWEGAKKDLGRLLNILPEGRLLRGLDRGLAAINLVEAAASQDARATAVAGLGAVSTLHGVRPRRSSKSRRNKREGRTRLSPADRSPFSVKHVKSVPREPGVYIIFDLAGPIYVGRSSRDMRRRLQSHLKGTGNKNIALARRVGAAESLTFSYCPLPATATREVEAHLIAEMGVTKYANLRHEGLFEEDLR
jgi:GIY-YIG catalytic domain